MLRQEQDVNGAAAKKKWVAPEVTRLEFPKTAGTHVRLGSDSAVAYVVAS